jgi:HEAT repeat protein
MKRNLLLLSLLVLFTGATSSAQFNSLRDGSYSWIVPTSTRVQINCWNQYSGGFTINDDVEGSGEMVLVAQMRNDKLIRLHISDRACAKETGATRLEGVTVENSLDFLTRHLEDGEESHVVSAIALHDSPNAEPLLERFAGRGYDHDIREKAVFWLGQRGGERGFRFLKDLIRNGEGLELRKKAVFAISQSPVPDALPELIDLARHHRDSETRREAIFWLGQKAGSKAAAELKNAVDNDPDDDVKEHAVFAISQLPRDRSVPLLIDLARNHKSRNVREKAIFWLSQTGDPRALDFIEEILTK